MNLLILGAASFQVPIISLAKDNGFYVVSADNNKNNPGHSISNKYYEVDIFNLDKLKKIVSLNKIDYVLGYASDACYTAANNLAISLGWPAENSTAVQNLINKCKFRELLNSTKIQSWPHILITRDYKREIINFIKLNGPSILKPVSSSGSKGVHTISSDLNLDRLITNTLSYSKNNQLLIEKKFLHDGHQICGDGYFYNGKIQFVHYGDGFFSKDSLFPVPYAESFPSNRPQKLLKKISTKIEKILIMSGVRHIVFNLDVLVNYKDDIFIIEIAPRNGGNFIPQMIKESTNVDLTKAFLDISQRKPYNLPSVIKNNPVSGFMVHSDKKGTLLDWNYDTSIKPVLFRKTNYIPEGSEIQPFSSGDKAIANILMKFSSQTEMNNIMKSIKNRVQVNIK